MPECVSLSDGRKRVSSVPAPMELQLALVLLPLIYLFNVTANCPTHMYRSHPHAGEYTLEWRHSSRCNGDSIVGALYTPGYHTAVIFERFQEPLIGCRLCREMPVSRTAVRLIVIEIPVSNPTAPKQI